MYSAVNTFVTHMNYTPTTPLIPATWARLRLRSADSQTVQSCVRKYAATSPASASPAAVAATAWAAVLADSVCMKSLRH